MNLTGFVKKLKIYLQEENKVKKWMKRLKNQKGLTLVELLAVIVILAIVGTIAFVMIGNVIENSKKDAHVANAQQLIASAKLYDTQRGNLGDGDTVKGSDLHEEGLLDELIDPWDANVATYDGTVTKHVEDNAVTYTVTMDTRTDECNITNAGESDLAQGRDVCN